MSVILQSADVQNCSVQGGTHLAIFTFWSDSTFATFGGGWLQAGLVVNPGLGRPGSKCVEAGAGRARNNLHNSEILRNPHTEECDQSCQQNFAKFFQLQIFGESPN